MPFSLESPDESVKNEYTIEMTRAIFTKETFEVFKKYELHVHKKEDKS